MELEILDFELDNQQVIATLGPVLLRVFRGGTDIACIDRGCAHVEALLERWPMAGLLSVAHHGSPFPDAAARRHASQRFGAFGDRLVSVQCVLGLGFWAEAARATAMAIARLARSSIHVESSVEAGAQVLALDMVGIDPSRLVVAHDQLLAKLDAALDTRAPRARVQ